MRTRFDLPGAGLAGRAGLFLFPRLLSSLSAALTKAARGGVTRESGSPSRDNLWLVPTGKPLGVPCLLAGEVAYWVWGV